MQVWTDDEADLKVEQITEARAWHNENRDCAVVALSILCDVSYSYVLEKLSDNGREKNSATHDGIIFDTIDHLGFECRRRYSQYHLLNKALKTAIEKLPEDKVYMIFTKDHVTAVRHGFGYDDDSFMLKRVQDIFEIVEEGSD